MAQAVAHPHKSDGGGFSASTQNFGYQRPGCSSKVTGYQSTSGGTRDARQPSGVRRGPAGALGRRPGPRSASSWMAVVDIKLLLGRSPQAGLADEAGSGRLGADGARPARTVSKGACRRGRWRGRFRGAAAGAARQEGKRAVSSEEISRRASGGHRANLSRRARAARPGRTRGGGSAGLRPGPRPWQSRGAARHSGGTPVHRSRTLVASTPPTSSCAAARPPGPGGGRTIGGGTHRHVLGWRPAVGHNPRAPARMGREDAVVEEQVDLGRGVSAASFARNSRGSNTRCVVPSRQAAFNLTTTCPSARSRRRSRASGGRSRYRHYADPRVMRTTRWRCREER